MEAVGIPSSSWVSQVVSVGPPAMLVVTMVAMLIAAASGKIQPKLTLMLSGIAAVFFGLWIVALPIMNKRRVYIITTANPQAFKDTYSLQPIRYRFGPLQEDDLKDTDFELPSGTQPVMIRFDLTGLVNSYDANLSAIARAAQNDKDCLQDAAREVGYMRIVAKLRETCPGSLVKTVVGY